MLKTLEVPMAKNLVQFQKGMSLPEFLEKFGTEEQCLAEAFRLRWPRGFRCPKCGNKTYCTLKVRKLVQCNRCRHQTSVTAGTIFHATKLPLSTWFLAIYLITQDKNGISALELGRQIGVSNNAAWKIKHKLMQVMLERDTSKKLQGRVEIDDAYLGPKRVPGKAGRGAKGKTPFIAAVQTQKGKPIFIKLTKLLGFSNEEIEAWGKHHLKPGTTVVSDALSCFNAFENIGCYHEAHVVGSGKKAVEHPAFKWVNTVIGNVKNSVKGTYHAIRVKHIPRYLAEFQYRFNRRFNLRTIMTRLIYVALRTPPLPSHLLTMAEYRW